MQKKFDSLHSLIFAVLVITSTAMSQDDYLEPFNGPAGGSDIHAIVVNDSGHIFAGSDLGVLRSTDNGVTWVKLISEKRGFPIYNLILNSHGDIFAASNYCKIWRSTNNGNSWVSIKKGLLDSCITDIEVDVNDYIYVATSTGGVAQSIDNGNTWIPRNTGFPKLRIDALAINARRQLFATSEGNFFQTVDDGKKWLKVDTDQATDIPTFPDAGWRFLSSLNTEEALLNNINWRNSVLKFGEIELPTSKFGVSTATIDKQGQIYVAANGYIFRSSNKGQSWVSLLNSILNKNVNVLAFDNSGFLYAGTDFGFFRSTDGGTNWLPYNSGLEYQNDLENDRAFFPIYSLTINSNGHIYAGSENGILFRSTNHGDSWTKIVDWGDQMKSAPQYAGYELFIHNSSNIILSIDSKDVIYVGVPKVGIFRSEDHGESWTPISTGIDGTSSVHAITIGRDGILFAGTSAPCQIYKSTDGYSWINLMEWTRAYSDRLFNVALAIAINQQGYIFVGTDKGIFRSLDKGNTWHPVNNGIQDPNLNYVSAIAINSKGHIFAGTEKGYLYISTDNGNYWNTLIKGSHYSSDRINSLIFDSKGYLFVGRGRGIGIYRSKKSTTARK